MRTPSSISSGIRVNCLAPEIILTGRDQVDWITRFILDIAGGSVLR